MHFSQNPPKLLASAISLLDRKIAKPRAANCVQQHFTNIPFRDKSSPSRKQGSKAAFMHLTIADSSAIACVLLDSCAHAYLLPLVHVRHAKISTRHQGGVEATLRLLHSMLPIEKIPEGCRSGNCRFADKFVLALGPWWPFSCQVSS